MFDAIKEGSDPLVTLKELNEKLAREMLAFYPVRNILLRNLPVTDPVL